jgi:D-3-phosphoglycerate dehydrogenase / 2-oxoglutarate reductase
MIKILANDGIHPDGKLLLEEANVFIDTQRYPQEELAKVLKDYDGVVVRSATKIRKELIDQLPNLKIIGRGGVGMDNIDVEYARSKGIKVFNTPAASSRSVAEIAFAHIFTLARQLHQSNRTMPTEGVGRFKQLKKDYAKGLLLNGKKLGIIGFGRIGQEVAKIGVGLGMKIFAVDPQVEHAVVNFNIFDDGDVFLGVKISTTSMDKMLQNCDIISVHVPLVDKKAILGQDEIARMKDGVILINSSRGGVIDEKALLEGLESGKIAGAGLDVFENEPTPDSKLLEHPLVSLSPHIGAETMEAQSYIGMEIAEQIIDHFNLNP